MEMKEKKGVKRGKGGKKVRTVVVYGVWYHNGATGTNVVTAL